MKKIRHPCNRSCAQTVHGGPPSVVTTPLVLIATVRTVDEQESSSAGTTPYDVYVKPLILDRCMLRTLSTPLTLQDNTHRRGAKFSCLTDHYLRYIQYNPAYPAGWDALV